LKAAGKKEQLGEEARGGISLHEEESTREGTESGREKRNEEVVRCDEEE